ncbi:serine hydrolase domain-containing protein [Streptomyces hygroscopicus]|uniref:serine hydrolase domain-containing protein n=1 Tax=Streptomyces hygroscopicus TaxID=1912 RepID=UPI00082C004E|nr:serine hydrolase domain-containing protein [Streptomyces hygroscopicus]GLV75508.1 1,4-butanediol diacrylate esterase [Streptomyces hygroscopicus subsp. hygroscopicus]
MDTALIDTLLAKAVERGVTTGVYAMAADREGIVYSGGAGTRDGDAPWGEDTIALLASMTKSVTAVAALQLVEQGAIGLDDPVADVLPELAAPQVLEGYDGDVPRLRPARSPVTLRRLLSHTGGCGYPFLCPDLARYHQANAIPSTREGRLATLVDSPLVGEPGTGFHYGMGLDWVGLAITRITGTDLETRLRERIFAPLGMADTAFRIADRGRLATLHARTPDGLVATPFEFPQEPELHCAGGGLYGSPRDYLTFLRMIAAGGTLDGTTILTRRTLAEARRSHSGPVGRLVSADPAVSHDIELLPGTPVTWSLLGMRNEARTPQGRPVGTLAWAGGANTYYWADGDADGAGAAVLFTQIMPFADPDVLGLLAAVERAVRAPARNG